VIASGLSLAVPCRSKTVSSLIRYPEHIGVFSGSRRCGEAILMVSVQLGGGIARKREG
jgi:hypothetical protein